MSEPEDFAEDEPTRVKGSEAGATPDPIATPDVVAGPDVVATPDVVAGPDMVAEPQPLADPDPVAEADVTVGVSPSRLMSILESLLFVADQPLSSEQLAAFVQEPDVGKVEGALVLLGAEWSTRGVQLHPVAGGWQLRSHPMNAVWVQRLVAQKPVRLTRSQLETLAIVAYRQPITRPEVDEIRGVDSGGTLKTMLERALVRILGKKEEPGRPLIYGTTKEFLEFFNLRDLRELPTLREFHELSDEHRAQVEALERAAPPGMVEPGSAAGPQGTLEGLDAAAPLPAPPVVPPLQRVELSDAPFEEDMGQIDKLIEEAGIRARSAAEALGTALPESPVGEGKQSDTDSAHSERGKMEE